MKTLKIGIAGYDQMKARTMAIARGERTPTKGEPKVWFTSIESFAKLLPSLPMAIIRGGRKRLE